MGRLEDAHVGCTYVRPGLRIAPVPGAGRGVITDVELEEGEVLVLETSVFTLPNTAQQVRECLSRLCPLEATSTTAMESRWFFMLPLGGWLLEESRALRTLLKVYVNAWWDGLFDFGAAFNHSCAPNAQRVIWHHGTSIVVASSAVAAGSEVTVGYGWTNTPRPWRRFRLFDKYGFWCCCDRCLRDDPPSRFFEAAEAELRAECEKEGLNDEALTGQGVTLYELLSDRGGDNPRRNFGRALARTQQLLEDMHVGTEEAAEERKEAAQLGRLEVCA